MVGGDPPPGRFMIRLQHARLSEGLCAVAAADDGQVTITVSTRLGAAAQRAAVRQAVQASREAGWVTRRRSVLYLSWMQPARSPSPTASPSRASPSPPASRSPSPKPSPTPTRVCFIICFG
jgi:hypothetical protein